jgi:hypothetical protein
MTETATRRRFAPRVAIVRDRAKEAAAERAGQGSPTPGAGRLSEAPAPTALGLGPGRPLPTSERAYFERRLGVYLAPVRVHPDAAAAAELGARGLAAGRDIAIAPGHWHPGTTAFRRLIGHELAHTLQQGESGPVVQLDGPDPPLEEAKKEDAADAVSGGLKTVAEQAAKNEALKAYGVSLARRYALPIWSGMTDPEKGAVIGWGATVVGVGLGAMLSDPQGRQTLSGVNLGAPIGLVPYATLSGFSFDLPKSKTDPFALHFSFKGDDLLDLAHDKAGLPKMSLSFDFAMSIAPDGKVTMPFALANFGVLPGVGLAAGWGVSTDFPPIAPGPAGAPMGPTVSYPKPAQPAPPGGVAVFFSVDLLKAPFIPLKYRILFGAAPEPKEAGK